MLELLMSAYSTISIQDTTLFLGRNENDATNWHVGGHVGPGMGTMLAGGAAAAAAVYGAHHLSHGHHGFGHHGKFKHGKFKHGKFGNRWKHGMFGGKHHGFFGGKHKMWK